jgi:hypothetical protein
VKTTGVQLLQRLALAALVAVMVASSWLAPLDATADRQVDAGLKRALLTFASARALNAVISVVQGTQVAIEPAGVGVVLTPGQVLDPVNDLVEQFSNLMLMASVSFGVQKVLISIGAHWVVSLILSIAALGWALFLFRREPAPAWLTRLLVILLMTRFAVPVVTIGADGLFRTFMATDYQSSQQVIDTASGNLASLDPPAAAPSESQGMLEKFKGWLPQSGDVKARFEQLKQVAERAIEHVIKLMVIFLLQTLLLPLLLLWVLYGVARRTFEWPARIPRA